MPVASDHVQFIPVAPWACPLKEDCSFYHTIDLPDGEHIKAAWDIREHFDSYVGGVPLAGKTMLDVGTASGFLTFAAEKAGATVTSLDARTADEILHIPHGQDTYHLDRAQFIRINNHYFRMLRNSYWYSWNKLNSKAEVVYAPLADLPFWGRKFDVVLAGAIVEHLADPVTMIGNIAGLAKETVIIAFTPAIDTEDLLLAAGENWKGYGPQLTYTWFNLSRGLYRQVFHNLGFDVEFKDAYAVASFAGETEPLRRETIVARRR